MALACNCAPARAFFQPAPHPAAAWSALQPLHPSARQRNRCRPPTHHWPMHACRLPRPSPAQRGLEAQLLQLVDGPIGDVVAALPGHERGGREFASLAAAVCTTLGTAVLRYRVGGSPGGGGSGSSGGGGDSGGWDPAGVVRVLRRLAAALLPDEEEEEAEEEEEEEGTAGGGIPNGQMGKEGGHHGSSDDGSSSSSSESSSSERSDASGSGDGDGDAEMVDREPPAGAAGPLTNPPVAAAAVELLQRLMALSQFLPTMAASAASPPPLPPGSEALPRPLTSLLPAVELPLPSPPPPPPPPPPSPGVPTTATWTAVQQPAAAAPAGVEHGRTAAAEATAALAAAAAAQLKKEFAELAESLLDLQQQYDSPQLAAATAAAGTGTGARATCRATANEGPSPATTAAAAAAAALLPLLMASYGGSLSDTDRAVWSMARAVNQRLWEQQQQRRRLQQQGQRQRAEEEGVGEDSDGEEAGTRAAELAALLEGPMSQSW